MLKDGFKLPPRKGGAHYDTGVLQPLCQQPELSQSYTRSPGTTTCPECVKKLEEQGARGA